MGIIELAILILFGIFSYKKVNNQGEIANWSWWKVTSPLWIYALSVLAIFVIFFGIYGIVVLSIFAI